jgi:hypothetical protein
MRYRGPLWAAAAVLLIALGLAGCARSQRAEENLDSSVQIQAIPGGNLHRLTLSEQTMQRLGIETTGVRTAPVSKPTVSTPRAGGTARTVVPISAVVYDPNGGSWTYTQPALRAFVREPVVIDHVTGNDAFLDSGPPAGTPVVVVGAPELLGCEYGVGEE